MSRGSPRQPMGVQMVGMHRSVTTRSLGVTFLSARGQDERALCNSSDGEKTDGWNMPEELVTARRSHRGQRQLACCSSVFLGEALERDNNGTWSLPLHS